MHRLFGNKHGDEVGHQHRRRDGARNRFERFVELALHLVKRYHLVRWTSVDAVRHAVDTSAFGHPVVAGSVEPPPLGRCADEVVGGPEESRADELCDEVMDGLVLVGGGGDGWESA